MQCNEIRGNVVTYYRAPGLRLGSIRATCYSLMGYSLVNLSASDYARFKKNPNPVF